MKCLTFFFICIASFVSAQDYDSQDFKFETYKAKRLYENSTKEKITQAIIYLRKEGDEYAKEAPDNLVKSGPHLYYPYDYAMFKYLEAFGIAYYSLKDRGFSSSDKNDPFIKEVVILYKNAHAWYTGEKYKDRERYMSSAKIQWKEALWAIYEEIKYQL